MTITTSKFQIYPDFLNEKVSNNNYEKKQTNSRYKNFCQTHFTAGDEEQFNIYKCYSSSSNEEQLFDDETNKYAIKTDIWEKYQNIDGSSISNTFKYMFYKFKKGIFVKIVNNELKVFLPFSNSNFINEWSSNIDTSNYNEIFKYVCEKDNRKYNERNTNNNFETWYCNNYLLRYEYPINEGDTNVSIFKNILEELCDKRKIPDIEFFINRRDFPLHTTNCCEPYFDIWDSDKKRLVSHDYEKYCPILSMSKTTLFEDILIPTHEDWARVQSHENIYFSKSRISIVKDSIKIKWSEKKPIAVFRGSSTGRGVTIETNERLKIAYMSSLKIVDKNDNLPYLDAGITKWNIRPRKLSGSKKLQTIKIESFPFQLVPFLSLEEQSEYKYIIHIDGHVSAFRLSSELSSKSLLLMVESEWKVWYSEKLKPYEHYIPIKKDLSDLISKIEWCKLNDQKCETISINAYNFFQTYLQKDSILDFFQSTLVNIKKNTGDYFYFDNDYKDIKSQIEKEQIINYLNKIKKKPEKIDFGNIKINHNTRFYGMLKSIQYFFLTYKNSDQFQGKCILEKDNIYKNKNTTIKQIRVDNYSFCIKEINPEKQKENIHEAFVGIFCVNEILKEIPNFYYTFDFMYNNNNKQYIVNEYIPKCITLFEYIKSDKFNFKDYLYIILQLCLSLHVSQVKFNFVHYDLTPWNILLKFLDEEEDIDYKIDIDKVITIKTKIIPIIIDYGKSYVSYKNQHYGFIKLFKFSKSQDIITVLLTSIYEIITQKHLIYNDFNNLLKLSNFLCDTKYRKEKFRNSKELKKFLSVHKKYSSLIEGNKYELNDRTPLCLYFYVLNNISSDFPIIDKIKFIPYMLKCNEEIYFKLFFTIEKIITESDFINTINLYLENKCDDDDYDFKELNCVLFNLKLFIEDETMFDKIIRQSNLKKQSRQENNDNDIIKEIVKPTSIFYTENDFLSIVRLKEIKIEIMNEKRKYRCNNTNNMNFESRINYMNNLTIINDFKPIIEKLIINNPQLKIKFTELI